MVLSDRRLERAPGHLCGWHASRSALWGNFTGITRTRLVNYHTGASVILPELKINASPPIYAGQTLEYAISPNGHYVAVLHGSLLSVYETPSELLQQASEHHTSE